MTFQMVKLSLYMKFLKWNNSAFEYAVLYHIEPVIYLKSCHCYRYRCRLLDLNVKGIKQEQTGRIKSARMMKYGINLVEK